MFPENITYLLRRISDFGNHYQKYGQIILTHFPWQRDTLLQSRRLDLITYANPRTHYLRDFQKLATLLPGQRPTLDLLGCYFAIQFLWFNISIRDWLDYQLSRGKQAGPVYRRFILNAGSKFRRLTAAYMQTLFDVCRAGRTLPAYSICSVGTRSDQDDIDVGILDDGGEHREWLNQVVGMVGVEMMRFATNFHFHLSEHVGHQAYSASIDEYQELLRDRIGNFVILTEMLGAALVIGDRALFSEFQTRVTSQYYFRGKPNRYHEGYLRGILGEISDLTSRGPQPERLHPKEDGLRIIKNLLYAYKVRLNIVEVNPWAILWQIRKLYPRMKGEFSRMETALNFLEIFRYLYQQLVVQEESIPINDVPMRENIQQIARQLYFPDVGGVRAVDQLLYHYAESVRTVRSLVPHFTADLNAHLIKHTIFVSDTGKKQSDNRSAEKWLEELSFFRGVFYWEDIFAQLRNGEHVLKKRVKAVFSGTPGLRQDKLYRQLAEWCGNNPTFLFELIAAVDAENSQKIFKAQNRLLAEFLNQQTDLHELIDLFRRMPCLVYRVLQICSPGNQDKLNRLLHQKKLEEDAGIYQKTLQELTDLVPACSYYFKRFIAQVYQNYPRQICSEKKAIESETEAETGLRHLPFVKSGVEKKQILGHYYDLNFFRLGMHALRGLDVHTINQRYTELTTIYLRELVRICQNEVAGQKNRRRKLPLTFYACGGNGRGQAFEDDFDLVVVLDSQQEYLKNLSRQLMSAINSEMIRRGTLPHFRFTEHFGEYICPLPDLKYLLSKDYPENFIDMSQILEARLIDGSAVVHRKFKRQIVRDTVFANARVFIHRMVREIRQRHGSTTFFREKCANIKECTGGLRDIEMIVLIYKAHYQLPHINTYRLIQQFRLRNSRTAREWEQIRSALEFLQRFRYVYRLMIAAEDEIELKNLPDVARKMKPAQELKVAPEDWLWQQFVDHRKAAWYAMRKLILELGE